VSNCLKDMNVTTIRKQDITICAKHWQRCLRVHSWYSCEREPENL